MLEETDTERSQVDGVGKVNQKPKINEPVRQNETVTGVLVEVRQSTAKQLEPRYEFLEQPIVVE